MYIKRAKIQNIRGIKKIDVPFDRGDGAAPKWIVIAGRNGTGKTTVLQALSAAVLGPTTTYLMLGPYSEGWISRDFLEHPAQEAKRPRVDLWLHGSGDDLRAPEDFTGDFHIGVSWSGRGEGGATHPPREKNFGFLETQFWNGASWGTTPTGWMLAGYGVNRLQTGATAEADQLTRAAPRRAALATLFRREASLYTAWQWVKETVGAYLENRSPESFTPEPSTRSPSPHRVRSRYRLLLALLNDGLIPHDEGRAEGDRPNLITLKSWGVGIQRGESLLPIGQAGQGFETTVMLVVDIIRQMDAFFGENFLGGQEWEPPAAGATVEVPHSGVVFIDEMENHLHPQLQQHIGPWLKAHFPAVQFIVTTHSPFICQAADPGGLFILKEIGKLEPVSEAFYTTVTNGSIEDAVMTEMFGLTSPYHPSSAAIRERLGALEARILQGQALTEQERAEKDRLASLLPDTPGTEIERILAAVKGGR